MRPVEKSLGEGAGFHFRLVFYYKPVYAVTSKWIRVSQPDSINQQGRVDMRSWRYRLLGFICLLGLLILGPAWPTLAPGAAAAPGKPALYEFGSKYCIPCKEMQKVMADLKTGHGDQVEFRLVYVDEERPLFTQYKIVAIPTQVFLSADGKEVDRHLGALPREEVIKKLKELHFIP